MAHKGMKVVGYPITAAYSYAFAMSSGLDIETFTEAGASAVSGISTQENHINGNGFEKFILFFYKVSTLHQLNRAFLEFDTSHIKSPPKSATLKLSLQFAGQYNPDINDSLSFYAVRAFFANSGAFVTGDHQSWLKSSVGGGVSVDNIVLYSAKIDPSASSFNAAANDYDKGNTYGEIPLNAAALDAIGENDTFQLGLVSEYEAEQASIPSSVNETTNFRGTGNHDTNTGGGIWPTQDHSDGWNHDIDRKPILCVEYESHHKIYGGKSKIYGGKVTIK